MNSIASTWRAGLLLLLFIFSGLSILTSESKAQSRVDQYIQESSTSNFEYVFDTYLGYSDDAIRSLNMPFEFTYDGTTYSSGTRLYISHNGWVKLGSSGSGYNVVGNSSYPGVIAAFAADQYSYIYYKVSGSSPNRVLTIMHNFRSYYSPYYWNYMNTKLYEGSNAIEFNYNYTNYPWYTGSYSWHTAGVGLNGNSTGGFTSKVYTLGTTYTPPVNIRYRPPVSDKPALTVTGPTSIDFGQLALGLTQSTCITVTNTGTPGEPGAPSNPLTFTPASIGGASDYTLTSQPTSLDIGESAEYCVTFAPLSPGVLNASFEIKTNAKEDGSKTVSLTGIGLAPVMAIDQKYLFRKTYTKAGYELEQGVAIANNGNAPLTITSVDILGEYADQYHVSSIPDAPIPAGGVDSVYVIFSPIYEGLRTAQLQINSDGFATSSYTIDLWGTGIIPRLTVTPGAIGIDSVMMGDTAYYTIRLENVGSDTVVVREDYFSSADRDFFYSGLVGSDSLIPPEKFRDVVVGFAPQTRGTRQARLHLLTNLPKTFEATPRDTSTFDIDFTVVGVPSGLLYVEGPTMVDSAHIGAEICRPVTIWNNGQEALTVTSAMIAGTDASDFEITGAAFPLTIAPMGSTTVQVCATPSARGLRSAMVTVSASSNGQNSTFELPLSVYGQLVCAQPSTAVAFENEVVRVGESSTAQILVNNCGDVPTTYNAVVTGEGYTLVGAATSGMVEPGGNHTFEVSFNPSVMASAPGTLTISGSELTDMIVALGGVGGDIQIAASDNVAPSTAVGMTSGEFTVTVTNNGNMDLTPGDPVISNSEFSLVAGSAATTIAAGSQATYRFTFTPSASGERTASVTFPSASPSFSGGFMLRGEGLTADVRPIAKSGYVLGQNYPNPVTARTDITFTMAEAGNAQIVISDVTGKIVDVVTDQFFSAGEHTISFDASSNSAMASGTYFYELVANGVRLQSAMLVH